MAAREERHSKKTGTVQDEKVAVKRKTTEVLDEITRPVKTKFTGTTSKPGAASAGISIKVGQLKSKEVDKQKVEIISKQKKGSVAAAFNDESDEEEEIPKEAKMRMKNLGKDTATSSGPNSFNKGKHGFTNVNKLREKEMKLIKH